MADENKKATKVVVEDKDHPSLIEVGGKIRLRVLEDFYVEAETPKWKRFREEWDKFKKAVGYTFSSSPELFELEQRIERLDRSDEDKEVLRKQAKNLLAMSRCGTG